MKKRKSERTRDKIIDMFYQLNQEPGKPISTVPEICDAIEISVSTFYCHFSGIGDLIDHESAKLKEFWDRHIDNYLRYAETSTPATIFTHDLVAAIVHGFIDRKKQHLVLLRSDLNLPFRRYMYNIVFKATTVHLKYYSNVQREYAAIFMTEGGFATAISFLARDDMNMDAFTDLLFNIGNAVVCATN